MAKGKCERQCPNRARFMVHVRTVPQQLTGPNGEDYGMESSPAGRANLVCASHISIAVRALLALTIRVPRAAVTVRDI